MTDEKELKDQRIPIMMTSSELQAIDDWSFKNRIRSRGEAIRRLCQIGLLTDENIQNIGALTLAGSKASLAASDAAGLLASPSQDKDKRPHVLNSLLNSEQDLRVRLPEVTVLLRKIFKIKNESHRSDLLKDLESLIDGAPKAEEMGKP